jgi:hypothetical protein
VADLIWRAFHISAATSALAFDAEVSIHTLGVEPTVTQAGGALAIATVLAGRAISSLSTLLAFTSDAEFVCVTVHVRHAGWMARLASEQHRDDKTSKRDSTGLEQSGNEGLHLIDQHGGKKRAGTVSARAHPSNECLLVNCKTTTARCTATATRSSIAIWAEGFVYDAYQATQRRVCSHRERTVHALDPHGNADGPDCLAFRRCG